MTSSSRKLEGSVQQVLVIQLSKKSTLVSAMPKKRSEVKLTESFYEDIWSFSYVQ